MMKLMSLNKLENIELDRSSLAANLIHRARQIFKLS